MGLPAMVRPFGYTFDQNRVLPSGKGRGRSCRHGGRAGLGSAVRASGM